MAGFTTHESSLDVFLRLGNASQVSKEEFKNVTGTLFEGLTQNKIAEQLVQYQYADDSDTTARERMIDFQSDFMTVALDCSQSPIFPCDRRDRARLTVNGGHLDFQSYRGGGRRGL